MTELDENWPLWQFKIEKDELFTALDEEDRGIALIEMPDQIDPQGLVNAFAAEIRKRKDLLAARGGRLSLHSANIMMPPNCSIPDQRAVELFRRACEIFEAIEEVVSTTVLPHTSKRKSLPPTRRLQAYSRPPDGTKHSDNNFLTTYLGATAPGHVMWLPDGTEIPLMTLPSHHVLVTRQREWGYLYPDFSLGEGIEHKVEWIPQTDEDFRAVGLDFIGK